MIHRILDALGKVRLQLRGGDRNAVEEEHQIDAVLIVERVVDLPHHPQAIGLIAGENLGIETEGRLELRHDQRLTQPDQLHPMPQDIEGTALIDLLPDAGEEGFLRLAAVVLGQCLPRLRLGLLDPGDQIRGVERTGTVIARRISLVVKPAVTAEIVADLRLEVDFTVEVHGIKGQGSGSGVSMQLLGELTHQ